MEHMNRRPNLFLQLAGFVLLLGLAILPAAAQQVTGSLAGSVKDSQGALVTTATIKASNDNTGFTRSTTVGSDGTYLIQFLPLGTYTVQVQAAGFKTFVQKNIPITLDVTETLLIALEVGGENVTMTVTDTPPAVNTADAELGSTISQEDVIGLPLVNRNVYAELGLVPGVMANSASQNSANGTSANFQVGEPSIQVQVNGSIDAGSAQVAFFLDGGSNVTGLRNYGNPLPNPDALQEFRVETSDFSAQYGKMGAAVITAVTKSGTNQFHGSLFEFNRNTDYNAYGWNSNPANPKQPYHRNNFGGTVGGPIKHDKAFFFFSYGGLRQVIGTPKNNITVLSDAERLGDFVADAAAKGGLPVYIPGSYAAKTNLKWSGTNDSPNCQTPTNYCIPKASLDKTTQALLALKPAYQNTGYLPRPNTTNVGNGLVNQWTGVYTAPTDNNEYLGKYDENFTNDHVAATYFRLKTTQDALGQNDIPWDTDESFTTQHNINLSDVHTFNATTANQAWLTLTALIGGRIQYPQTSLSDLGTTTFTIQGPKALPQLNVQGGPTFGVGLAGPVSNSEFYSLRDMVTKTKGKNDLVFGGEFALDKTELWANLYNYGIFGFTNASAMSTGFGVSDFLAGEVNTMEQDLPYQTLMSAWHTSLFVQDNYKVSPRLTLNLGLRWDIDTAPVESLDHTAAFVAGQQSTVVPNAPVGLLFPGDAGIGRGISNTKYHHIAPRIGAAWDPFGDGKTAIRLGAGMFYGSVSGNEWNQPGNAQPYCIRQTFNSITSFSDVYSNKTSFPNGDPFPYHFTPSAPRFLAGGAAVETINPKFEWPLTYQMNFAVQRQLPQNLSVTAAYVGTISRDQPTFIDANYPVWAPGATTSQASVNARRPYFGAAGATNMGMNTYLESNQTGSFHSLQVTAVRPMSKNLTMSGFFVWEHALESSNETANGLMSAQDFANIWEERGPMDADYREAANLNAIWNIDYYRGSNFFVKNVLNGWTLSPIWSVHSGGPFTVSTGADANAGGNEGESNRPNLVPGVNAFFNAHRPRSIERNQWFNAAAFTVNGPGLGIGPGGVDGNEQRDYLRGPGYKDVDLGLFRTFKFERGIAFQLRGEASNVFNLVSLNNPASSMSNSSTIGKITGASQMRVMQIGGRLTF